jgi:predicted enzyme related to lactoylglutathione lyase
VTVKKHPVVHFEIGCHGGEKTREFFAELFGWDISGRDAGMTIKAGDAGGIGGHIVELAPEWGTYVTIYVEVEDLEVYLKKAVGLGGKTLVPPVTLPGKGSFAWLAAPEGNIIGIWKSE